MSSALTIPGRHFGGVVTRSSASAWVPELVAAAGSRATDAYIEFFTATIRNRNTRLAYARACYQFFHWSIPSHLRLRCLDAGGNWDIIHHARDGSCTR
jgi:hypothetical protein